MLKIQKVGIVGIILFVAMSAIVFLFWQDSTKSTTEVSIGSDKVATERGTTESPSTTTITLSKNDYSNEVKALPPTTTKEQYLGLSDAYTIADYRSDYEKKLHTASFFIDKEPTWNEVFSKFGEFGTRFLSGKYDGEKWDVGSIEEVDIDGDQQKEKIVDMADDGNHTEYRILIIKNQKIIFSVYSNNDSNFKLVPLVAGNGFYLEWIDEGKHYSNGYCCPTGYMKTKFVLENNKFLPVSEQEVLYLK